jgi:hypothetical protein
MCRFSSSQGPGVLRGPAFETHSAGSPLWARTIAESEERLGPILSRVDEPLGRVGVVLRFLTDSSAFAYT